MPLDLGGGGPQQGPPAQQFDVAAALMSAGMAPQMIQQLMSSGLFGTQVGFGQGQMDLANRMAQQGFGNTMAALGISEGALGRQQGALPQMQGLERQLLGLSQQRLGLQGQGLSLAQQMAQRGNVRQLGGEESSATARGAINTQGHRQQVGDINQSLADQMAQLALSRQGLDLSRQGLGIQGQQLNIGQGLQSSNLADQLARLNLQKTQAGQGLENALQGNALGFGQNILNQFQNVFGAGVSGALGTPGKVGYYGAIPPLS